MSCEIRYNKRDGMKHNYCDDHFQITEGDHNIYDEHMNIYIGTFSMYINRLCESYLAVNKNIAYKFSVSSLLHT